MDVVADPVLEPSVLDEYRLPEPPSEPGTDADDDEREDEEKLDEGVLLDALALDGDALRLTLEEDDAVGDT